jgi:hypothetical protein
MFTSSARSMEVGRILPKFVTPDDVRDLKNRVDPFVRAMDAAVKSCAGAPDDVRTSWQGFSTAWRSYFDEEDSWWHTAAQMDQGEAYEKDLAHWQEFLGKFKCAEDTPRIDPSTDNDGGGESTGKVADAIKAVAIAGGILAVVLGLRTVIR